MPGASRWRRWRCAFSALHGPDFIHPDESAAAVYGASWQSKSSASAVNGTYLQNRKQPGQVVIWTIDQDPNFPAGFYDVFVKWLAQDGTQTTYYVTSGTGSQQIDVLHAGHSRGDWVHLGTFVFQVRDPVRRQTVALWGDENNSGLLGTFLLADAVKAVPLLSPLDLVDLRFIHGDHLGTPHVVMDETGTVVWNASYLPFGEATVDEDPDGDLESYELSLRFPGQYKDSETGLHYNYFRDYDPSIGRYIESDPIGLRGGMNTFAYAGGNPISQFDQYGLVEGCTCRVFCLTLPITVVAECTMLKVCESGCGETSVERKSQYYIWETRAFHLFGWFTCEEFPFELPSRGWPVPFPSPFDRPTFPSIPSDA